MGKSGSERLCRERVEKGESAHFCAFQGKGNFAAAVSLEILLLLSGADALFRQGRREDVDNEKDTMAANPPLVMGMNGCLTPAPFAGEYFILGRDGIKLEMDNVRTRTGKWTAEGYLFLSHVRMVFVAPKADASGLQSFDFPLAYVTGEKFNQPIFGCNNLAVKCYSVTEGPNSTVPPHSVKFYLKLGGCGTLLPMLFRLLERTRNQQFQGNPNGAQAPSPLFAQQSAPPTEVTHMMNTAHVDHRHARRQIGRHTRHSAPVASRCRVIVH